ncbi:MAG: hypothetical protein AAFP16_17880 [Pseudomonadota bacterium]
MITQELRDIRVRPVATVVSRTPASDISPEASANGIRLVPPRDDNEAVQAETLGPTSLRRDGNRPLRFDGCLVFQTDGHWSAESSAFDHRVSVFRTRTGELIAALSLNPEPGTPLRPIHWAEAIPDACALDCLLEAWCRDILIHALNPDRPARLSEARSALQTLTSHAMWMAKPDTERKVS